MTRKNHVQSQLGIPKHAREDNDPLKAKLARFLATLGGMLKKTYPPLSPKDM
jgi:hypothetical protein